MKRSATAFTLIELIVAMGIAAVLTGLGVAGLNLFRQTIQFQQANLDFVSALRTVQNMARNSVSSQRLISQGTSLPQAKVDGYAIFFTTSNYSIRYCIRQGGAGNTQMNCSGVEQDNLKPREYADVQIFPANTNVCQGVFFERLTGDIRGMSQPISNPLDTGSCTILIDHINNASLSRQLNIDITNNNIDF